MVWPLERATRRRIVVRAGCSALPLAIAIIRWNAGERLAARGRLSQPRAIGPRRRHRPRSRISLKPSHGPYDSIRQPGSEEAPTTVILPSAHWRT